MPRTGNALRIGLTGTPGAGKSTFLDAFGMLLIQLGKRVAVIAVDPSSPLSGGSLLGDKTRMTSLARAEAAFIRPVPSGGYAGGVSQRAAELILLCEAANYDVRALTVSCGTHSALISPPSKEHGNAGRCAQRCRNRSILKA